MVFKFKKHIKIIIFVIIFLIIITFFNLVIWYTSAITPNFKNVVYSKMEKQIYEIITSEITSNILNDKVLKNVLIVTKNSVGEIITVDYDLEKAYRINNLINDSIRKSLTKIENGNIKNPEFHIAGNGMYVEIPFTVLSKKALISNMGPDIPVAVSFVGTVITNLETKMTDYGLNNVLNELFVTIEIKQLLTTPVTSESITYKYNVLIDAAMINGRVPSYYGSEIISESNLLDIPL